MKLTDYIIDRLFSVVMFLVAVIFSMGLLWLMGLRYEFIIYIEIIFGFSFLAAFVWDYTRKKKYYCGFMALFDGLDDKTLLAELAEKPGFLDGKLLYQILRLSNKYMNDKLAEAGATNQEYREYIEMWVHEIKTPITSAHLIIENDKNISTIRIDDELNKIDHFVEQALFYARSTTLEKDFKIEKTTLKTLVQEALKSYSKQIIEAHGRPVFENLDKIDLNGTILQPGGKKPLGETVLMTSVGNNDRGTFIVPDHIAASLAKDMNILLVQYKPGTNTDEILQKMIPIGLEWETEGYRYTEKIMLSSMYYGSCALLVFLCCYIGLVFLLICAALLSLKQLTETADNIYRYGLLQKLETDNRLLFGTFM